MKHFDSLGLMLDCSRNAVMSVEELKKYITVLNRMGYNQFQLYMEDTYEIEGEPFFGYHRGRYTPAELKELNSFCQNLGVDLVPNIQTLAHLNAIMRWPEYKEINDCDDILLVEDEKTYTLIENMLRSLRQSFTSDKIHIGMDEAHMVGRGKYMDIHGTRERSEIFLSHINRVCALCKKYGFKPMMWSDMFYTLATGGHYDTATTFNKDISSKIPDNLTLVYWEYWTSNVKCYDNVIKGHQSICDRIAFGGGAIKWVGHTPHNTLSIKSTKAALTSCIKNGIKDVFITSWGDDGAEASAWSVLPTLCYAACLANGITKLADIKQTFKDCTGVSYDDFMLLDLPDRLTDDPVPNPSKYLLYNDCFMGIFDGNVAPDYAQKYASYARKLRNAAKRTGEFSYIFDKAAKLCSLLSVKADLGLRTRKAYLANDKEALEIVINDYSKAIKKAREFYTAFKTQWFNENKPHGFDIQDMRLGGLIMRLESCKERLIAFKNGEISEIPELCDEPMILNEGKPMLFNSYGKSASTNVLSW